MTIELKMNHLKMGLMSRSNKAEWYTADLGKIGFIHVHNDTESGQWVYTINTAGELISRNEYPTKEIAFSSGLKALDRILAKLRIEIEELV